MTAPDPLLAVRAALDAGASTRKEIALTSGLDRDLVDLVLDTLVRSNALEVHALKFECGAGGCGNCAQDSSCTPAPRTAASGPVPLSLPLRPL